ncbi:MAG: SufD family Fe-S cluster assembly protein [Patescibacteria group bacterium]
MFKNISQEKKKNYKITTPGEYVFYFENKSGDITFDIQCENANVKVFGLYTCKNSENFSLNITQKHSSPNSISEVLIKSILTDSSIFNFTGTIQIPKNSKNSTAHLTNNNLLLDTKSQAITSPQLKVVPSEVDCKHSAKTTPLDAQQLEYIIYRGISKDDAKKLLLNGFTHEITQHKKP